MRLSATRPLNRNGMPSGAGLEWHIKGTTHFTLCGSLFWSLRSDDALHTEFIFNGKCSYYTPIKIFVSNHTWLKMAKDLPYCIYILGLFSNTLSRLKHSSFMHCRCVIPPIAFCTSYLYVPSLILVHHDGKPVHSSILQLWSWGVHTLKGTCRALCMFHVWPEGILSVWHIQEMSNCWFLSLQIRCHLSPKRTRLPVLQQNPDSWGLQWAHLTTIVSPRSSHTGFCVHIHSDRSLVPPTPVCRLKVVLGYLVPPPCQLVPNTGHFGVFITSSTDKQLAFAPSSWLSKGACKHGPPWWRKRSHTSDLLPQASLAKESVQQVFRDATVFCFFFIFKQ